MKIFCYVSFLHRSHMIREATSKHSDLKNFFFLSIKFKEATQLPKNQLLYLNVKCFNLWWQLILGNDSLPSFFASHIFEPTFAWKKDSSVLAFWLCILKKYSCETPQQKVSFRKLKVNLCFVHDLLLILWWI